MDGLSYAHIRRRLEGQLRREVPDEMWDDLVTKRYVADSADRHGWAYLVAETRRLLRFMELGAQARTPHRQPTAAAQAPIQTRGQAFDAWVTRLAGGTWLERARAICGGLFTREEATEHLLSYAWCLVPVDELCGRQPGPASGPRIRDTVARIKSSQGEVRAGARGITLVMELAYGSERREITVWHDAGGPVVIAEVPGAKPVRTLATKDSFAALLPGLAEQCRIGTSWTVPQMLWFIFTDEVPQIKPLAMDVRHAIGPELRLRPVVSLEVEPWVPVGAVAAAYHEAQAEALGRANRPMRERSVELARFLAVEGWGLSVREQMRTWSKSHPQWAEDDPRNFQNHARRAVALLIGPPLGMTS